jgi:hypothetical protein
VKSALVSRRTTWQVLCSPTKPGGPIKIKQQWEGVDYTEVQRANKFHECVPCDFAHDINLHVHLLQTKVQCPTRTATLESQLKYRMDFLLLDRETAAARAAGRVPTHSVFAAVAVGDNILPP